MTPALGSERVPPPEVRAANAPPSRGQAADRLLAEIERALSGYAARLRTDPETPSPRALSDASLEDHTATVLAASPSA